MNNEKKEALLNAEKDVVETILNKWYVELCERVKSPFGTTFRNIAAVFNGFKNDMEALMTIDDLVQKEINKSERCEEDADS